MVAERPSRRQTRALPVYPTRADVHRMLEACESERDRMLIELLWVSGGRISEVLQARVGDVTERGLKLVNLKQATPTQKHVFLPAEFMARLRAYCGGRSPAEPILGRLADGKPLSRKRAWEIISQTSAKAGILKKRFGGGLRPLWPHAFRHGNAVHLIENGVPLNAVSAQLGHASLGSTQVYLALTDPHRERLIAGVKF